MTSAIALAEPGLLPLLPAESVRRFGASLVVAPHPDDETLGCGGCIALLRAARTPVHVLVVSDGAASHPRSRRYPPARLALLREAETATAMRALGVDAAQTTFLRLADTAVPASGEQGFEDAVARCLTLIQRFQPTTVFAPWRREPHRDHRASSAIVRAALERYAAPVRLLEYPIWVEVFGTEDDRPRSGDGVAWRLAIDTVLARKRQALAAYRSQSTALIDDDPTGFRLSAADLARFTAPWELFLEPHAC